MKTETLKLYMQQRQEVVRCKYCQSPRVRPYNEPPTSITNFLYCEECERPTDTDVETVNEWAERTGIYLED